MRESSAPFSMFHRHFRSALFSIFALLLSTFSSAQAYEPQIDGILDSSDSSFISAPSWFNAGPTSRITAPNSGAADLFWRTDGTTGSWTGSNWSNPATTTGGTAWTSGDDAFFTANSTVTFASTAVADVTLSAGISVTVSQAGTLSPGAGGVIRTFDIGAGSTLTWTNQTLSGAAGSEGQGVIKNGDGTLNLGAVPSNVRYDGGFTLNAGTVIVSGNSSFGTAGVLPATLTINGGNITVNFNNAVDRTFANPVSLNGNVVLGHLGSNNNAAIWSGNVNLGGGVRTITNNAPTTSTRVFSGQISNGGLAFDGTGTTILSNANSYAGGTAVNSGTLLINGGVVGTSSGTGTGSVAVSGGTLGGTGNISGTVGVSSGAINPGTAGTVGTLHVGALTMTGGTAAFDFTTPSSFDQLISAGAVHLGTDLATLSVTIASNQNFAPNTVYSLITGSSLDGTFNGIVDGNVYTFSGYEFTADYTNTSFDLIAVPEPSTWIGAALALSAVGWTQRRRFAQHFRVLG
jgi:autotransporter-associated beta strand protein